MQFVCNLTPLLSLALARIYHLLSINPVFGGRHLPFRGTSQVSLHAVLISCQVFDTGTMRYKKGRSTMGKGIFLNYPPSLFQRHSLKYDTSPGSYIPVWYSSHCLGGRGVYLHPTPDYLWHQWLRELGRWDLAAINCWGATHPSTDRILDHRAAGPVRPCSHSVDHPNSSKFWHTAYSFHHNKFDEGHWGSS